MRLDRTVRAFRGVVAAVVVFGAACNSSPSGPSTITDPVATITDLLAIDSAFGTAQFSALAAFANVIPTPAPPAPLARVVQALRLTLPPAAKGLMLQTMRRPLPRRSVAPLAPLAVAGPNRVPVIPDTLLGTTFVWDTTSVSYVTSNLTGAPVNGVRFVLYDTTVTGLPDVARPIGTLDIIDRAPAVGVQLEFLLLGNGDAPTYLDYTLTLLPGTSGFTINAAGFVSNGRGGALERRFGFNTAITHTDVTNGVNESADLNYSVNVPNVSVSLHLGDDSVNVTAITSIDYKFTRRNESIRLLGGDTTVSGDQNGAFKVTVNNNLYATATIAHGAGAITDKNGNPVPIDNTDQHYEDDVFIALLFGGVIQSVLVLAAILVVPGVLLGFTFGLL